MKNAKSFIFIFSFLFLFALPVKADFSPVNVYFFYGDGCPHCAKEKYFLDNTLKKDYPYVRVYQYEVYKNEANAEFLQAAAEKLGVSIDGVPFLVIGDQHFVGYAEGFISESIKQKTEECFALTCDDPLTVLLEEKTKPVAKPKIDEESLTVPKILEVENNVVDKLVEVPFFGSMNLGHLSLPLLALVMGALDGFNPCAMWTLLFLISLLLGMQDRKRMWILGGAFILASAFVYFLFMSAWLHFVLFLGLVSWLRLLIGLVAIFGAIYSIKEFLFNKTPGCKITGEEKRQRVFEKLKNIVQQNSLILALAGIILLAFIVNIVELFCSAGLPAIYTQVLTLNGLMTWQYYLYIGIYIFFFMLDDLVIFIIAMLTLQMTGITTKYSRMARLIGGILMLVIGLLLIFKPEVLMFA